MIHPSFSALFAHSLATAAHNLIKLICYSLPLLSFRAFYSQIIEHLIFLLCPSLLCKLLARIHEVPFVETLRLGSTRNHVGNFLPVVVCEVVDSLWLRSTVLYYSESEELCFFIRPVLFACRVTKCKHVLRLLDLRRLESLKYFFCILLCNKTLKLFLVVE